MLIFTKFANVQVICFINHHHHLWLANRKTQVRNPEHSTVRSLGCTSVSQIFFKMWPKSEFFFRLLLNSPLLVTALIYSQRQPIAQLVTCATFMIENATRGAPTLRSTGVDLQLSFETTGVDLQLFFETTLKKIIFKKLIASAYSDIATL